MVGIAVLDPFADRIFWNGECPYNDGVQSVEIESLFAFVTIHIPGAAEFDKQGSQHLCLLVITIADPEGVVSIEYMVVTDTFIPAFLILYHAGKPIGTIRFVYII